MFLLVNNILFSVLRCRLQHRGFHGYLAGLKMAISKHQSRKNRASLKPDICRRPDNYCWHKVHIKVEFSNKLSMSGGAKFAEILADVNRKALRLGQPQGFEIFTNVVAY